jgi:2-dehydro-3-deoxyphosphogluconate aldolase/(4S)-4-hydroxy-2-oxoglutarate aldolase
MVKHDTIGKIHSVGVVAVIRAKTSDEAYHIAKACLKGGISAIEITFTVPNAEQVIKDLKNNLELKDLLLGAGTVLDAETARIAILAGANYIVSPGFNLETAKLCNRYQIPYMPGCLTITEMITAMEAGVDIIKLFPGSAFGPDYIKAVKGPLPHINIMPTGGVSLSNVSEWIKNGVFAIGVGSDLTAPAAKGDYDEITKRAAEYVLAVKNARN